MLRATRSPASRGSSARGMMTASLATITTTEFTAMPAPTASTAAMDWDILEYYGSDGAVRVNLARNAASGGHAQGDTITRFEGVVGSPHDDRITATPTITISSATMATTVSGAAAAMAYSTAVTAPTAWTAVRAGTRWSTMGRTQASRSTSPPPRLRRACPGRQDHRLRDVEGSQHDDRLTGDNADNEFFGGDGDDTLAGRGGPTCSSSSLVSGTMPSSTSPPCRQDRPQGLPSFARLRRRERVRGHRRRPDRPVRPRRGDDTAPELRHRRSRRLGLSVLSGATAKRAHATQSGDQGARSAFANRVKPWPVWMIPRTRGSVAQAARTPLLLLNRLLSSGPRVGAAESALSCQSGCGLTLGVVPDLGARVLVNWDE